MPPLDLDAEIEGARLVHDHEAAIKAWAEYRVGRYAVIAHAGLGVGIDRGTDDGVWVHEVLTDWEWDDRMTLALRLDAMRAADAALEAHLRAHGEIETPGHLYAIGPANTVVRRPLREPVPLRRRFA